MLGGLRGRALSLGAAALAGAVLAAPAAAKTEAPARADSHTIKVGIVYSRSGLLSNYGAMYAQGVRLGLEYATRGTNRVNGHRIELTLVDDAGDPAKAVSAAKDLIGQGYKIIGGSTSSGVALQMAPLAEQNKVLFIAGAAATDAVTGANRYTFRAGRQTIQDIQCATQIIPPRESGKKVVTFAQDSAFGQSIAAGVSTIFGGKGHSVSRILVPLSATDFTPFAAQLRAANPDLVYVAWAGTTATAMYTALQQQGISQRAKVLTGIAERSTWNLFGRSLEGLDLISLYFPEASKNRVNRWLRAKMRRRNQAPDIFTPDGFVTAQMIVRAIQRGGDDVERMISGLEGWQFVAPKGVQKIRQADHAMIQPMYIARLVQQGSSYRPRLVKTCSPGNLQPPVRPFSN
jgi:branched-chain amino acid transport system substrate-binding protein